MAEDQASPTVFRPPRDWEAVYAADAGKYFFGEEPSQIARVSLAFFHMFGGDPFQAVALDLGCGEGRDTAYFAAAGLSVVARDIAPTGLAKMRALFDRRGLSMAAVDALVEDVSSFSHPKAAYDITLAANVYQFLTAEDVPEHIQRLQGATKPGGICAVGVFSPAMLAWGADLADSFTATPDQLMAFFAVRDGWRLLDRTEYWTYRPQEDTMASFAFVVFRKSDV